MTREELIAYFERHTPQVGACIAQLERERDEARAEVERLKAEAANHYKERFRAYDQLEADNAKLRAEVAKLQNQYGTSPA